MSMENDGAQTNGILSQRPRFHWTGGLVFVCVSCLLIVLAWLFGVRHDYVHYVEQWTKIFTPEGPWIPSNAYGPFHLAYGLIAFVHPLLPKIGFQVSLLCCSYLHVRALGERIGRLNGLHVFGVFLLFSASPLAIGSVTLNGMNEGILALFVFLAVLARAQHRFLGAAFWFSIGGLLKFYPLLFAPLLIAQAKNFKALAVPIAAAILFAVGMGVGFLMWGDDLFKPFTIGTVRRATMLSPLYWLTLQFGDGPAGNFIQLLSKFNAICVLFTAVFFALHGMLSKVSWRVNFLVGSMLVLFVYKVGHPQYYLVPMVVWAWVLLAKDENSGWRTALCFAPVFLYLNTFDVIILVYASISGLALPDAVHNFYQVSSLPMLGLLALSIFLARREIFLPWHWNNLRRFLPNETKKDQVS